jgi:hypothetical protein
VRRLILNDAKVVVLDDLPQTNFDASDITFRSVNEPASAVVEITCAALFL